ncbi:HepT-like ribonuclease domain-containing protein [Pedobacter hartonius]|uniref:HepT-like ribonuclease domain-containing protein n=1 Tax=Pedobacter hartonius TaxID=425514 RepID=UPI000B8A3C7F
MFGNSEKRFATIEQIEIIGEACNAITNELKSAHTDIPWRAIIGFRNMSIHEYSD